MENCSFSDRVVGGGACHSRFLTSRTGVKSISNEDKELLSLRTGVSVSSMHNICLHHEQRFLNRFSSCITRCCNPFGKHTRSITRTLSKVTNDMYNRLKDIAPKAIPGEKMCLNCRKLIKLICPGGASTSRNNVKTKSQHRASHEQSKEIICEESDSDNFDIHLGETPLKNSHTYARKSLTNDGVPTQKLPRRSLRLRRIRRLKQQEQRRQADIHKRLQEHYSEDTHHHLGSGMCTTEIKCEPEEFAEDVNSSIFRTLLAGNAIYEAWDPIASHGHRLDSFPRNVCLTAKGSFHQEVVDIRYLDNIVSYLF